MPKKNIFIISIILLLIAGGVIGGYFAWQTGKKAGSSPQPIEANNQIQQPASQPASSISNLPASSPSDSDSDSDSDISNWNVYSNKKYRFDLRYPSDWDYYEDWGKQELMVTFCGPEYQGNCRMAGKGSTPAIVLRTNYLDITQQDFCNKNPLNVLCGDRVRSRRETTVGGKQGSIFEMDIDGSSIDALWKRNPTDSSMYEMTVDNLESSPQYRSVFNQMLSSFKFTASPVIDNPNWRTYTNYKYGFSIKIPKDATVDTEEDGVFIGFPTVMFYPKGWSEGQDHGEGLGITFPDNEKDCFSPEGERDVAGEIIPAKVVFYGTSDNPIKFKRIEWDDHGMGCTDVHTIYATEEKNQCIRFDFLFSTASAAMMSEAEAERYSMTVRQWEQDFNTLTQNILSSFRFTASTVSPNEDRDAVQVLSQLREDMNPLFSELQSTMFYWQEGAITSLKISGYKIQSRKILTDTQNDRVLRFFENNGFITDEFNLASGTMSGSRTGFRKDNLVCIVNEKYKAETEVSCGRRK